LQEKAWSIWIKIKISEKSLGSTLKVGLSSVSKARWEEIRSCEDSINNLINRN